MEKNYEEKINELLSKMTLEEKVGQLQQCGPSLVGAFEVSFEELLDMMFDGRISKEEFDRLMGTAKQDFHEEELKAGNAEFREAAAQTRKALEGYGLPEAAYFLETFMDSFSLTLDELK